MIVNMHIGAKAWIFAGILLALTLGLQSADGPSIPPHDPPQGNPAQTRSPMRTRSASQQGEVFARFEPSELRKTLTESGRSYLEFLRVPSMNCGVYRLPAGGRDGQSPHGEDEIYHCLAGRAKFEVGGETLAVEPGTTLFVSAGAEHRFIDIVEDLELLVVFASAPKGGESETGSASESGDGSGGQGDGGERGGGGESNSSKGLGSLR